MDTEKNYIHLKLIKRHQFDLQELDSVISQLRDIVGKLEHCMSVEANHSLLPILSQITQSNQPHYIYQQLDGIKFQVYQDLEPYLSPISHFYSQEEYQMILDMHRKFYVETEMGQDLRHACAQLLTLESYDQKYSLCQKIYATCLKCLSIDVSNPVWQDPRNYLDVFETIGHYELLGMNHLYAILLLNKKSQELLDKCQFFQDKISHNENMIMFYVKCLNTLDQGNSFGELLEFVEKEINQHGFNKIICCQTSAAMLNIMQRVIKSVDGGVEFFVKNSLCNHFNMINPIINRILSHTDILNCRHSGNTLYWTLNQFKTIYRYGLRYWIGQRLLAEGIGWDHIDFATALDYGVEDCLVYLLENDAEKTSGLPLDYVMIEKIIPKEMTKACQCLLAKYAHNITLEDYDKWRLQCLELQRHQMLPLFILDKN